ncbi:MAG: sugar ABC transporter ATP-binding protein [Micromonosporaceae bacterium]
MAPGHELVTAELAGEPPSARNSPELLIRVANVAKAFGATQALADCSFELRAGEIHALVGENGSGKSTLVKILSGVHSPDAGVLELEGRAVPGLDSPRAAQQHGIVTIFQEVLVAGSRSVLENVWLGADGAFRARHSPREKAELATSTLRALLGEPLDLDTPVEELSLRDRQACAIVRALLREPRVLILDEATSALDVAARDRLFELLRGLSRRGVGVIFISHRMDEISEIGDRITVMRVGRTVATLARDRWTPRELVRLMTGSDKLTERAREHTTAPTSRIGGVVLRASDVRLRQGNQPFDVGIRAGELVGLAGLEGHGQGEFLEALWGKPVVSGSVVRVDGERETAFRSPSQAAAAGVVYVPRERGRDALFGWMSVVENFGMPTLRADTRFGLIRPAVTRSRLADYVRRLGIVMGQADDRITTLSGGNQQKVVIARWLAARPKVLLLDDPTRGIDVSAKHDLYELLTALAAEGVAVVMLSTEVDEHVELMDRVLIFREHRLFRELDRGSLSREALVSSFFGQEATVAGG